MGDEASSCTDLIRALENAGLSHYDTVKTLNRLHENQVLTDSGFRQAIERVSAVLPNARPSASASDVLNRDEPRQSGMLEDTHSSLMRWGLTLTDRAQKPKHYH